MLSIQTKQAAIRVINECEQVCKEVMRVEAHLQLTEFGPAFNLKFKIVITLAYSYRPFFLNEKEYLLLSPLPKVTAPPRAGTALQYY